MFRVSVVGLLAAILVVQMMLLNRKSVPQKATQASAVKPWEMYQKKTNVFDQFDAPKYILVEVQGVGLVKFPGDAKPDEITAFLNKNKWVPKPPSQTTTVPPLSAEQRAQLAPQLTAINQEYQQQQIADAQARQADALERQADALENQEFQQEMQAIDQEYQQQRIADELDDIDWDLRRQR